MSLALLLDEASQAKYLINLMTAAGHDVLTVNGVGMNGSSDEDVLAYAQRTGRTLLTRNCDDFRELHEKNPKHSGIVAIYIAWKPQIIPEKAASMAL
ncbi:MAG: DUF5615 family PIN-like protein [Cyanobacteria bacterium J06626_18]